MKQAIVFLFLYSLYFSINAQITFNRADHLSDNTLGRSVIEMGDSYYVSGVYVDDVDSLKYAVGSFLIEYDINGELENEHIFIDSSLTFHYRNQINNLTLLKDGTFMVSGNREDLDDGDADPYLMKISLQGNEIYKRILESEFENQGFELTSDFIELNNGDVLTATRCERDDQGQYPVTEICLYKFDAAGNFLWYKSIQDSERTDFVGDMQIMPNGNVMLFGGKNYAHSGNSARTHASLTEIDTAGEFISQWLSPIEDSLNWSYSGTIADDGNYIFTTGTQIFLNQGTRLNDPIIKKLDKEYNPVWENIYFKARDTLYSPTIRYNKIINLRDENTYVACGAFHTGFPDATDGNHSESYGWLVKINDNGEFLWKRHYQFFKPEETLYENHYFQDVFETNDFGFIACGEATPQDFSPVFEPKRSWLVKMDEYGCLVPGCQEEDPNSIDELDFEVQLKTFPNPTTDVLNVFLKGIQADKDYQVKLINSQGKCLSTIYPKIDGLTLIIDMIGLPPGPYFLQLRNEIGQSKTVKVVKQ